MILISHFLAVSFPLCSFLENRKETSATAGYSSTSLVFPRFMTEKRCEKRIGCLFTWPGANTC